MSRRWRVAAAGSLFGLATLLVLGILVLHDAGGRVETLLLISGDRVWVTLDVGRPRFLLLLSLPAVLLAAAVSVGVRRPRG